MPSAGVSPFNQHGQVAVVDDGLGGSVIGAAPTDTVGAPDTLSGLRPNVYVVVETSDRIFEQIPTLTWERIDYGRDGADYTATLTAVLDSGRLAGAGSIGSEHFAHLIQRLRPERRVRIIQARASGALDPIVWFEGYPLEVETGWNARDQRLSVTCYDVGQQALRTHFMAQVLGRWMRRNPLSAWDESNPDLIEISAMPAVFNADGLPNRSQQLYALAAGIDDGTTIYRTHLFVEDASPSATYWRYVDAIAYVACHYVARIKQRGAARPLPISVAELASEIDELLGQAVIADNSDDPFDRRITAVCDNVSIASMSAAEALTTLCSAAGLHWEAALNHGLSGSAFGSAHFVRLTATVETRDDRPRIAGTMIPPAVRDVSREAPFTDQANRAALSIAGENRHYQANLSIDRRTFDAPIVLGGSKEFEVTLLMRPGWRPHLRLDNLESDEERDEALAFWIDQFPRDVDPVTKLPRSIYHARHPAHGTITTDGVQTFRPSEVGRLWIFPDDHRWCGRADGMVFTSDYARGADGGPSDAHGPWPARLYSPLNPDDITKLVLIRGDIGGAIAEFLDEIMTRTSDMIVPHRRPLMDVIGRMRGSGDRAPIVRFNYVADSPFTALADPNWTPFEGQAHIDERRAAMTIIEDNLYGAPALATSSSGITMIEAYLGFMGLSGAENQWGTPHFHVSVTCTVRSDQRMIYRGSGSRAVVIDTGLERFRLRKRRGQNSHLNDVTTDDEPEYFEDRDDQAALNRFGAETRRRIGAETVRGTLSAFFLDPHIQLGDSFSGASGLGITFDRYPSVVGKSYLRSPEGVVQTELHLSDLRDAPEFGS